MIDRLHASMPTYTPDWTERNDADPGVTTVQLFAFVTESLLYRVDAAHGRVDGLAVQADATQAGGALHVSPGLAIAADGNAVDLSALASRYIGETEKNLAARFSATAPSDAALRYDDASALLDDEP